METPHMKTPWATTHENSTGTPHNPTEFSHDVCPCGMKKLMEHFTWNRM